jgi:hypothetical protein
MHCEVNERDFKEGLNALQAAYLLMKRLHFPKSKRLESLQIIGP